MIWLLYRGHNILVTGKYVYALKNAETFQSEITIPVTPVTSYASIAEEWYVWQHEEQ